MRITIPIIILLLSGALAYFYTRPLFFEKIEALQMREVEYQEAFTQLNKLQEERIRLETSLASFSDDDLEYLATLLPDEIDEFRFLADINTIAARHSMIMQDLDFERIGVAEEASQSEITEAGSASQAESELTAEEIALINDPVKRLRVSFSVSGPYRFFNGFLRDLERSLALVDIQSISVQTDASAENSELELSTGSYGYSIVFDRYWFDEHSIQ